MSESDEARNLEELAKFDGTRAVGATAGGNEQFVMDGGKDFRISEPENEETVQKSKLADVNLWLKQNDDSIMIKFKTFEEADCAAKDLRRVLVGKNSHIKIEVMESATTRSIYTNDDTDDDY